jgi:hypothetical protein
VWEVVEKQVQETRVFFVDQEQILDRAMCSDQATLLLLRLLLRLLCSKVQVVVVVASMVVEEPTK